MNLTSSYMFIRETFVTIYAHIQREIVTGKYFHEPLNSLKIRKFLLKIT